MSPRLHTALLCPNLTDVPDRARAIEALGLDGVFTFEGPHEPFMALALAAEHTQLMISTQIAVAFARTPMTIANLAWDLQNMSGGRFALGIGSQVRAHIEARYSMPWGKPVSRMREFVRGYHAIFDCWQDGAELDFQGDFYTHRLMPPMFRPGKLASGRPPVWVAGVGPKMIGCAGQVADGHVVHPFHTQASLAQITQPAIAKGRETADRDGDFSLVAQALVVTGADKSERQRMEMAVRTQIAFYGSTPAYAPVLEVEGRQELSKELHALSKKGVWMQMAAKVDDALFRAVAIVDEPEAAGAELARRYRDVASDVAIATPMALSDEALAGVVRGFRAELAAGS